MDTMLEQDTKTYAVQVVVTYHYEVEADSKDEAEMEGWAYENYAYTAEVYSIDVEELESEGDDE